MENIIIEASQRQGTKTSEFNGDYKINFSKGYYIYEGDEVAISKVFIDNKTSSDGIIKIDNDLNITGSVALYTTNNDLTKVNQYAGQAVNDNNDYFLSSLSQTNHPNYPNIARIRSFFVQGNQRKKSMGSKTVSPLTITYLDILGQKKNFFLQVPFEGLGQVISVNVNPPIIIQIGSLGVDNVNGRFEKQNIFPSIDNSVPPFPNQMIFGIAPEQLETQGTGDLTRRILTPINFPFQFNINAGNYLPPDLAVLINDKLTLNFETNSFNAGQQLVSPFFKTYLQAIQGINNDIMVSNFGKVENSFVMNPNFWIGSNLIDLEFD